MRDGVKLKGWNTILLVHLWACICQYLLVPTCLPLLLTSASRHSYPHMNVRMSRVRVYVHPHTYTQTAVGTAGWWLGLFVRG